MRAELPEQHLAVVIDTTSRAVHGDENSADTIRDFYRFTGIRLRFRRERDTRGDTPSQDDDGYTPGYDDSAPALTDGVPEKSEDYELARQFREQLGAEIIQEAT